MSTEPLNLDVTQRTIAAQRAILADCDLGDGQAAGNAGDVLADLADRLLRDAQRFGRERDKARTHLAEAEATIVRAQAALGSDHPVWWILDDYDGSESSIQALRADLARVTAERAKLLAALLAQTERAARAEVELAEAVAAHGRTVDQMGQEAERRRWELPPEPGPAVLRLRPPERYPGDNGLWLERDPDGRGWCVVMLGRRGEPLEWVQAFGLGMAEIFGGRPLLDATGEADGSGR